MKNEEMIKLFSMAAMAVGSIGFVFFLALSIISLGADFSKPIAEPLKFASEGASSAALSIESVSLVSEDISKGFQGIAGIMGFEIYGLRPLQGSSDYFQTLGDDTSKTSENMKTMSESLASLGSELKKLSDFFSGGKIKFLVAFSLFYISIIHLLIAFLGFSNYSFLKN